MPNLLGRDRELIPNLLGIKHNRNKSQIALTLVRSVLIYLGTIEMALTRPDIVLINL
jgi:hypothetical protein